MWYAMQVVSGREGQTVVMMERILSREILEGCLIPMRRLKKKYNGKWQEVTEKLFPGYVFLISEKPQLLYDELKKIPALTKLLGSCEEYFTPLSKDDVRFLQKLQDMRDTQKAGRQLCSIKKGPDQPGTEEVGLSQVIVGENRQIRIISGPLKNLEGQIQKINLHKRIAVVKAEFMGNQSFIHLGIEIVEEGMQEWNLEKRNHDDHFVDSLGDIDRTRNN